MDEEREPEGFEEVDAVAVLADEGALTPRVNSTAAGMVVAKHAAAVAATSFAAGVATVAVARAVRARRRVRSRSKAQQLAPVLATRSFLIDVHLLGSRD